MLQSPIRLLVALCAALAFGSASGADPAVPADSPWTDVSHSLGFPLGTLGSGYSAFGQYGIVRVFFEGREPESLATGTWEYTRNEATNPNVYGGSLNWAKHQLNEARTSTKPVPAKRLEQLETKVKQLEDAVARANSPAGFVPSAFGFVVRDLKTDTTTVLQTTPATWLPEATPCESAVATVLPPKGRVVFQDSLAELEITVDAYTPLLPHDLAVATLPVQVYQITVKNLGAGPRRLALSLEHGLKAEAQAGKPGRAVFKSNGGQLAFAADGGETTGKGVSLPMDLPPGGSETGRFFIAWHYPKIDWYKGRYYTREHKDTSSVLDVAQRDAAAWSKRIDAWHASVEVPAYLKRLWFGSLSSIMTSSIMTAEPFFLEVETPHWSVNTMDVCVYSNWAYMINWPELERMDLDQYFSSMKTEGPQAGLVWHSLWNDAAKYVEEPTFLVRLRRADLWFNDPTWTRKGFPHAVRAAQRVFTEDNQDGLVVSKHGNQSYDIWRMPGISSYVNSAWVYGLASLQRIAASVHEPAPAIAGEPLEKLIPRALASYDKLLWNPKTNNWNLFYRTKGADGSSTPDTLFTDQLFGLWVILIDRDAPKNGLPPEKIKQALRTLYEHNRFEDPAQGFKGWVNGLKPGRIPVTDTGYHARTFWFGPQINLASLLGYIGDEKASLDVMEGISNSLGRNVVAAGEWNRALNKEGKVIGLSEEICKDTPRFAPYPRYKSSWEYVVRMLGLTMDEKSLYFAPFKTVDFAFRDIQLAGMQMDLSVQAGWTKVLVDGKPAKLPLTLPRTAKQAKVEFVK